jgi:hypothetical protein
MLSFGRQWGLVGRMKGEWLCGCGAPVGVVEGEAAVATCAALRKPSRGGRGRADAAEATVETCAAPPKSSKPLGRSLGSHLQPEIHSREWAMVGGNR